MRELLAEGTNSRPLVLIDHEGSQALDVAAYFLGDELQNVRCSCLSACNWYVWLEKCFGRGDYVKRDAGRTTN